ncbi:hypothetical protein K458DRAFT_395608 [Lentithecium fluviatile CBS 122367]|uniref:Cysteine-rich transmembrane CYSTM domain-containing protein n=1 Tax=Lentithecium fluviatile CBS 122367 TaxID=1168545 RepID=A0A6G1IHU6_9PLEO|nr:hypothetical protein K458DRAFT_395608 [Lentithecium fluviatile CBS 122367]
MSYPPQSGEAQGYYGNAPPPPQGQYYGSPPPPPPQQMNYQPGPPPPATDRGQKKDRGCLATCLATLCCCWLCGEACECCIDILDCCC